MTTYRSPLCLDIIDSAEFTNQTWVRCSCGFWFTEETLVEFASSREKLSKAQKKFAEIREFAKEASAEHYREVSGGSYVAPVVAAQPAVNGVPYSESVPVFQPAPVAVKPAAPKRTRNLPTLSTSQWLLTVMAGLIAIALTIFFSRTWEDIPPLAKIGVVGLLSAGFSFGAIKSKKYFVALANVLAIIASATTFIGLQALSSYEILPRSWSDSENTPYVSIMLAIVTAGSLLMGRRFKIWGWLIIAPVGAAVSAILFTYNYIGQLLGDGYNHAGYQIAMLSVAILGVVAVARFTRLEAPVVAELPKAKKDQTDEAKQEIAEAEYQLSLHTREQASLSLASKFSIFAILGYLGFLAGSIATQIFPFTKNIAGQEFLGVDPVGLIIAAVFWLTGATLLNKFGPAFTSVGEISSKLANFIWITAFSITAFAISYSAQWVASENYLALLLVGALTGSIMIFAQTFIPKISNDEPARLGSLVGSIVLWGTSLSLWTFAEGPKSSAELVSFTTIVAAALLVRSAVFASVRAAYFSTATYFAGLVLFIATNGSPDILAGEDLVPENTFLNFAISLAATGAWTVALTVLKDRIGISARFTSGLQSAGVALFTFIALARELPNVLPTMDSLDVLPLLEVLTAFGLVFMALALIPAFRAIEDLRKTLAYSSFILLGAGFVTLAALGLSSNFEAENFFAVVSAYTLLVVTMLAVYGTMAKRLIALQMGLVFSGVLALSTQSWSFEWFTDFATPAIFMVVLGAGLFVHSKLAARIESSTVDFNKIFYPAAFTALAGIYLLQEIAADLDVLNYSFAAFVIFGIANYLIASGRLLKVADESKRTFDLVALFSLGITSVQSIVTFEPDSLVRLAVLSIVVGGLLTTTKRSVIRELDAWAASTFLIQLAVLAQLPDTEAKLIWSIQVPAIAMLLTGLIYISSRARVRKSTGNAEFTFATRVLPSRVIALSVAGLFTSTILKQYATLGQGNNMNSVAVPVTIGVYLLVSGLFISRRWVKNVIEDADRAVALTVPVIWGFGFIALLQAKTATGGFLFIWLIMYMSLWTAIYFLGIAVLSYITALIRKSPIQAFAGYAAGLLTTFYVVSDMFINNRAFQFNSMFLVGAIGFFIFTTYVLKKIKYSFSSIGFPIMLPISIFLSLVLSLGNFWSGSEVPVAVTYVELCLTLGLAVVALFMSRGKYLGEAIFTRVPMLISAVILYVNAYRFVEMSSSTAEAEYRLFVIAAIGFAALAVFIRRFHAPIGIYVSLVSAFQLAFTTADVLVRAFDSILDYRTELIGLLAAAAIATVAPLLAELYSERWKTILKQGLPLAVLLAPGVLTVYAVVSADFMNVAQFKLIEAIGLIAVTTILLVVGIRLGNLGIALVSGSFLTVTVLPILWQSVSQVSDDRTRFELQALFAGLVLYGILAGIRATFKLQMNSILYVGVPSLIAILPTLFGVIGKLGLASEEATSADWTRLAIVLGVSVVFLLLGSVRRLAGFFVPGGIALIVTVIPLLWTSMTSLGSAFVVVGLLLLAALIGFVAVRLEQVKGSARSASKWLRELK